MPVYAASFFFIFGAMLQDADKMTPDIARLSSWTPFHLAAQNPGGDDMMRALIDKKVDLERRNARGQTALAIAASTANIRGLKMLLACGANTKVFSASYAKLIASYNTV